MKIAVTDACIFIDLIELDLVSPFFQLPVELHSTIDVINELYSDQKYPSDKPHILTLTAGA